MNSIDRAIDVVPDGASASVLFTRGDLFTWNSDNTGTTETGGSTRTVGAG